MLAVVLFRRLEGRLNRRLGLRPRSRRLRLRHRSRHKWLRLLLGLLLEHARHGGVLRCHRRKGVVGAEAGRLGLERLLLQKHLLLLLLELHLRSVPQGGVSKAIHAPGRRGNESHRFPLLLLPLLLGHHHLLAHILFLLLLRQHLLLLLLLLLLQERLRPS